MRRPTQNAPRFLRPEVLARIAGLELLARGVVEGFVAGLHRSPYRGFSVEFMEYRPYIPGDDPLRIDWKLFARSDRYYVKEFEDETNTRLHLAVDVSASMDYASGAVRKRDYAFMLAASLAYFVIRQRDAVGLTLFDERVVGGLAPRSTTSHLRALLRHLEQAGPGARSAFGKPLHELAERWRRRGFVVLVSDLLDAPETILDGLRHFRFNGHEVIVFHVLDPREVDFAFGDLVEFEDLETGERRLVQADAARTDYLARLHAYLDRLRHGCARLGVDYTLLTTDQPLDYALFNYLAARRRSLR
ncbi:DUF58 domain-containing protein [Rhodocaloribacter litoris]|uniref:DUF58 domain-containing protein n=1 Tax=Rhodocaloribacter litoris TaxID=2558931 RepID=UPI0014205D02|nr:DUF58 domain-containing protein [Rhodocaloribacter litoris]QXD16921.1 DUF58 domain-containing protein [Rhodocaloribacter litoris]GIV60569.1 MAG: hypothetical protein KatS3mg043_1658 [Rhodothermaceae bacterium]